ncbi:uncharacterized protein LOC121467136 [Drosophila elegans]|uniref:uncharacterized protein LOC121467136 n=1 Tax=Drosophila elegans TaxID=30023 RepID=UPI001BC83D86|nr:uncharacterized protein LOC121467136 [Drosophila elegans]
MKWIVWLLLISIANASLNENTIDEPNTWILNNILGNGNENSNACTNFSEYACDKNAERHKGELFSGVFQEISHKVNHYLIDEVKQLWMNSSICSVFDHQSIEAKLIRLFHSCLKASLKTRKIGHFLRLAPPGEGLTWPLLTTNGPELKWMNTLAYLYSQYGFTNVLVDVQLRKNYGNKLINPNMDKLFDYGAALRILYDLKIVARLPLVQNFKKLESYIQTLAKFHDNGKLEGKIE